MSLALRICLLFSFVAALCLRVSHQQSSTTTAKPPEQDEIVRVSTALVTVPLSIHDRHGKPVVDLRQEEFRIYEDGVEQEIVYFEAPDKPGESDRAYADKPLTVALLLDLSDSTQFRLKQIQDAASAFVSGLRPEDRVLVIGFDKRVQIMAELTNDRAAIANAINRATTGGGTSLYDALELVIRQRLNRMSGRKTIVLFSDGVDTASKQATYNSSVRAAEESDAAIYAIQYNTYGDFIDNSSRQTDTFGAGGTAHMSRSGELASDAYKRATIYLRLLAEKTGGRFEYTDNLKNLSKAFARVAGELRQQYALGYYPKNQSPNSVKRQVKVSVPSPYIITRVRKTYIYRANP